MRLPWKPVQSALWNHEWSVISAALNNSYEHPHQTVLDDLKIQNPVLVNQLQGVAWGGIAGWKNARGRMRDGKLASPRGFSHDLSPHGTFYQFLLRALKFDDSELEWTCIFSTSRKRKRGVL